MSQIGLADQYFSSEVLAITLLMF